MTLSYFVEDRLGVKLSQGPKHWKYNGRILDDFKDEAEVKSKHEGDS